MPVAFGFIYIYLSPEMCRPNCLATLKANECNDSSKTVQTSAVLLSQIVAADLQARIKGDFSALHQILLEEEACLLEQLKREQAEELEKVQRHRDAAELGLRELENNLRILQKARTAADSEIMTEVRAHRENNTRLNLNTENRLIYLAD